MEAQEILGVWERASVPALAQAGQALKEFSGLDFAVTETETSMVSWEKMASRLTHKIKNPLYAVVLGAKGLFQAHILLLFSDENSQRLVTALMGAPVDLPLDEMGESALAEVGNVVGTAFLNVFADLFRMVWEPTPPQVRLTTPVELTQEISPGINVLLSEALFQVVGEAVSGEIVVIPTLSAHE